MKSTTQAYREEMERPLRNQSVVEVIFQNSDPEALTDGVWSDNGHVSWSEQETLNFDYDYGPTVCTSEQNRCVFGDRFFFPTKSQSGIKDGMVSSIIASGKNEPNTSAVFTRRFSIPHSFMGVEVTFDSRCKEWPDAVSVTYRLQSGRTVSNMFYSLDNVRSFLKIPGEDVVEISIAPKYIIPGHRARLEKVTFGQERIFKNNDIVQLRQKHDVDPLSRRAPKEEFSFSILDFQREFDYDNPAGAYKYISEHPPVAVRYGIMGAGSKAEWLKEDRYIMAGKPEFENNIVTFKATGLSGSMSGTFYKSKLGRKNLYDMAEEVLFDAKLTPKSDGGNPWVIHPSLKNMYTDGVLPIQSHVKCLQTIAHAARCRLYTDDENVFHLDPFSIPAQADSGFSLDFNSIMDRSLKTNKIAALKDVHVKIYGFAAAEQTSKLFEGTTEERVLHVEFRAATNVKVLVDGSPATSAVIYAQAADVTLPGGTHTVKVEGNSLTQNATVYVLHVNATGDDDEETNPLITDLNAARALATHVSSYIKLRNTYDVSYRGNPELEVGDAISMQTEYTKDMDALILTDEINFNGSLSGRLKLKGFGSASTKQYSEEAADE